MDCLGEWVRSWEALGACRPSPSVLRLLLKGYREPHRAYHTERHLISCLRYLKVAREQAESPALVALALFFHDVAYDTRRQDNEKISADWAFICAVEQGLSLKESNRLHRLVMCTCHARSPESGDEALLQDIDLAILGASPRRFARYEVQIRAEYHWVPAPMFRKERVKLLESFLDRTHIYHTALFHEHRESQARSNLERSISSLSGRSDII